MGEDAFVGQVRGRRLRTLAVVAGVALAIGIAGSALATQLASGVDTYTGCLTTSGDLSKFAKGSSPAKSCTGSQVQVSFSGPLPSECAEGDVLAWRSGAWTCSAQTAPDAFVAVRSGPVVVQPNSFAGLGSLHLEPGAYAVSARVNMSSRGTSSDPPATVSCSLSGSSDGDSATVRLAPITSPGDSSPLALLGTVQSSGASNLGVGCFVSGSANGVTFDRLVIRAVEVGSVTTVDAGPGPLP